MLGYMAFTLPRLSYKWSYYVTLCAKLSTKPYFGLGVILRSSNSVSRPCTERKYFYLEAGGNTFLRNVCNYPKDYTASRSRGPQHLFSAVKTSILEKCLTFRLESLKVPDIYSFHYATRLYFTFLYKLTNYLHNSTEA